VPWKFVEKLFFNQGLISDLIFFWDGRQARFFQKKCNVFSLKHFVQKNGLPRFLATTVNLPKIVGALNNLFFLAQ